MSEYVSRRRFLFTLALAPAAAACVARADVTPAAAKPPATPAPTPSPATVLAPDPLDKIRAFRIPDGTEPAFVFRALPQRPGRPK